MLLKIRRDLFIILALACILIISGRLVTYVSFASSPDVDQGVEIAGIVIKGNDIAPIDSIRVNVQESGLRAGSYIKGDMLITSKKELPLNEAIANAEKFATLTTISGTTLQPITAADVKVDKKTGIVTVNVIEDFSAIEFNKKK
ncbi:MAG: hypothetical protein LBM96_01255 [Methanobrevibacter sp.]|jgi:hypothetical protein|nr:hypothetical protein [Candidatus Methanoflexus mossambicus]